MFDCVLLVCSIWVRSILVHNRVNMEMFNKYSNTLLPQAGQEGGKE